MSLEDIAFTQNYFSNNTFIKYTENYGSSQEHL